MKRITVKIDRGYASLSEEIEENIELKQAFPHTCCWCAIVTNYVTSKDYKRNYFDLDDDYQFDIDKVNINDIVEIKRQRKKSNKYSYLYHIYAVVTKLDDAELQLDIYTTIAQAVKAQKQYFKSKSLEPNLK